MFLGISRNMDGDRHGRGHGEH
jgi:ABC-type Zn2+ transport system substrate-binding protein/surface adhesin